MDEFIDLAVTTNPVSFIFSGLDICYSPISEYLTS